MNTHDSGLAHGTTGNPQTTFENQEYPQAEKELEKKISGSDSSGLTNAQKSRIKTVDNTITNNLKESDFSGALRDLQNNPVSNSQGKSFNHELEMKNSYKALTKARNSLRGSLKNPNLNDEAKKEISGALDRAEKYLKRIEDLFRPYGGIR